MSYENWQSQKDNMEYQDNEVVVRLRKYFKMKTVDTSHLKLPKGCYSWIGHSVTHIKVILGRKPVDYCERITVLDEVDFGEDTPENYSLAEKFFKTLVTKQLQGDFL